MYLDFYGFNETPFSLSPNPRFIFYSKTHKEAFALLLYGINKRFGFIELTGEVGTGKTTVLRTLLSQLDDERYRTALIFNPSLSAIDLLRAINREFGIPSAAPGSTGLIDELNRYLLEENAAGRTVVLIIDEAQNLAPDVLEQIRLISNLETDSTKLIQIVLAGQPELARLLDRPELRQINQRIALRYSLHPLDREDFRAYIEHRLTMAGGRGKVAFTAASLRWLFRCSRGTPRLINILCDRALLIGYTEDRRRITGRTMALAFRDVMLKPAERLPRLLRGGGALLAAALLLAAGGYAYIPHTRIPDPQRPAAPVASDRNATRAPFTNTSTTPGTSAVAPGFTEALRTELALRNETKNALQAFNALVAVWQAPPLRQLSGRPPVVQQLKKQAKARHLEMASFSGSLDELLRLDAPALLVLAPSQTRGTFVVALSGVRDGKLLVAPPLLGRNAFSKAELSSAWSGQAYLLWRNIDNIPPTLGRGSSGKGVTKLQSLLRGAGFRSVETTGRYDGKTAQAVREFQASRKIGTTGNIGPITLLQLYRATSAGSSPGLAASRNGGGR